MNALLRSEFSRFRSRSLVAVVVVGGLILIGVGLAISGSVSRKPTASEVSQARLALSRCPQDLARVDQSGYDNGYYGGGFISDNGSYYNDYYFGSYVDGRCYDQFRSQEFAPSDSLALAILPMVLLGSSVIFVAVGIYFGASLVGADWHHRSMTTLLTWESRRGRVYLARMGTVIFGTFLVVFGLEAVGGVALALTASLRGTLFGADAFWLRTTIEIAVRVAALSAIVAATTASLAMIARSTGAALGLLVAYFGYEQLMQAISPTTNFWVLGRSLLVFISADSSIGREVGLDFPAAVAAIAMYSGACLLVGYLAFNHRDVS